MSRLGVPNRLGGQVFEAARRNGRPTLRGVEVDLVRWEREPFGGWGHRLVTGVYLGRVEGGIRLLVEGADEVFAEADGWAVCCSE